MQPLITLSPLHLSELKNLHRVCQDSDLRKYLMEGMEMTFEDCQGLIFANDEFVSKNQIGLYFIRLSGEIIGYGGFKETYPAADNKIDFMYAIIGKYFGRGLGTHVVRELLAQFKESRSPKKVTAIVNPKNIASIKILEKYNFIFKGFAAGELNHLYLYEL